MVPDLSTRLQVMQRSLREVIIPAITPENQLALEQANMMIGYIAMIMDQHDRQLHLDLAELRDYCTLTHELLELAQSRHISVPASAAAHTLLRDAAPLAQIELPSSKALRGLLRALKSAADELLRGVLENGSAEDRDAARKLMLPHSTRQLLRERVWLIKAGFELEPEKLPSIDSLLAR